MKNVPKITAVKNEAFLVSVTKNLTGREIWELFIMDIGGVEWNGMVFPVWPQTTKAGAFCTLYRNGTVARQTRGPQRNLTELSTRWNSSTRKHIV